MEAEIIQQLQENAEMIESHLINIESGIKILMTVALGLFVWAVIRQIYKLFGGIFFGGL